MQDVDESGEIVGRRCRLCGAASGLSPNRLRHNLDCPLRRRKNAHGQGSRAVYRPSDGRYWAALTLPDGRRKDFYGKTAAEANRKRDRARAQIERGLPLPDEKLTTGAWLQYWFDEIHVGELKPSTIRSQRTILNRHLVPGFRRLTLVRLTGEDVNRYLKQKLDEGLTAAVVGTHRGMLHKALQAAAAQDKVGRNVVAFTSTPKRHRTPKKVAYAAEQALAFLRLIRGHPLEGVFLLGMALGLRMGEATGVLWEDLDLDQRLLYLRHQAAPDVQADGGVCICGTRCGRAAVVEDLKSESSTRGLRLPEVIVPALRRQVQRVERTRQLRLAKHKEWVEHGLVFPSGSGRPINPNRVRAWLEPLTTAAGLPPCRFHDLRHAWGSLMKAAGASDEDLAQALGHASPQVTRSVYLHALPASADRVAALVNEVLPPDPADLNAEEAFRASLLSLRVHRKGYVRPLA
jgi:integrase